MGVNLLQNRRRMIIANNVANVNWLPDTPTDLQSTSWFGVMTKNGNTYTSTVADTSDRLDFCLSAYNGSTHLGVIKIVQYVQNGLLTWSIDTSSYPTMDRIRLKHNGKTTDMGVEFLWHGKPGAYTFSCNIVNNDIRTIGGFVFSDPKIKIVMK